MRSSLFQASSLLTEIMRQLWLPAVLLVLWYWLSAGSTSFYFPPLHNILAVLLRDIADGPLPRYIVVSLTNLGAGLAIAIVMGISVGLLIGESERLRIATEPVLAFFRALPSAAIVPIVLIAMGVGAAPKIFIVALGCFWPILLNTIDGVRAIPATVRETTRSYRIPPHLVVLRVALPAAMPQIMAGIRVALSIALILVVISEFFGADAGIGFYIKEAGDRFAPGQAWAGTILVGALGYLLSSAFRLVEHHLLAWYFQSSNR